MLHRPASPRLIEELPEQWTAATASPPGGSSPALHRVALPDSEGTFISNLLESTPNPSLADIPARSSATKATAAAVVNKADGKGKGRQGATAAAATTSACYDQDMLEVGDYSEDDDQFCSDDEIDNDITLAMPKSNPLAGLSNTLQTLGAVASSSSAMMPSLSTASETPNVPYRPHHPQNQSSAFGFGVKGTPGGDCKRVCLRHQRMVDGGARVELQKVSLTVTTPTWTP